MSMQLADQFEADENTELLKITQETGWSFIILKTFFFLLKLYLFLPTYVRRNEPDIILFSSMVTGSVAHFVRKRVKTPMVSISHGHDVKLSFGPYQWLVPKVFKALDAVISVSTATQEECLKRGLDPLKSKVLPNGFNIPDPKLIPTQEAAIAELEREFNFRLGERKLLITAGRLIKRKGHEWFIREVLPRVKSDVVYFIIGDGGEAQNIRNAINESGMGDRIFQLGRQPDEILNSAYAASHLFIMPNVKVKGDMEGFGIVLLEANFRNTPAIASNLEGIRDVIKQGENGYRIEPNDAEAFARKIDDVLENELPELSDKCRSYVTQHFSWKNVGQDYIRFLRSMVV